MAAIRTARNCPAHALKWLSAGSVQQGLAAPRHARDSSGADGGAARHPGVPIRSQSPEAPPAQQQDTAHETGAAGSEQHYAAAEPDNWPDNSARERAQRGEPPTIGAEHCRHLSEAVDSGMEWLQSQGQPPVSWDNTFPRLSCVSPQQRVVDSASSLHCSASAQRLPAYAVDCQRRCVCNATPRVLRVFNERACWNLSATGTVVIASAPSANPA